MKVSLFIGFILFMNLSIAQSANVIKMDTPPIFPGCENSNQQRDCFNKMLQEHIRKNFNYPVEALIEKIEGKVLVQISIDSTGAISKIQKKGPSPILENEVVRILNLLPKMTPATYQGKKIKVPFSFPVNFKITRTELKRLKEMKKHAMKINEQLKKSHY